jgi:hypothetical protein
MEKFDPVAYSDFENEFLMTALGKPTVVALRERPATVNVNAVRPILERVNELMELEKHDGLPWCGLEALRNAITTWQKQNAKWKYDFQRTRGRAPRWPSMWAWDAKGRGHRGGPGSDSDRVRTYFGPAGERIPFAVDLQPEQISPWSAPSTIEEATTGGMFIDKDTNRIECRVKTENGLCGHTESYKAGSRSSYNAARARFSKHLRKATDAVEDHRELHTLEFGQ